MMKHPQTQKRRLRDTLTTAGILLSCFGVSLLFHYVFKVYEHITTVFVFAVFLVSLVTTGYAYGIAAAVMSMLAVNYAFSFPYFEFNFILPGNLISAVVMIVLAILTSTLVTRLKEHEARLAETEKERLRANLLRGVSHDLRTPLTTIYGSASTLLESGEGLNPAQRERILKGIMEDSQWLTRMVENLLSVTRIGTGSVSLIKTPTVLEELLDSVMVKVHKRYPRQEVLLDLPEEMVVIPMDAMLIEQVLMNLLENAILHAKGMRFLRLEVRLEGKLAVFLVEDDGCGLPPDKIDQLLSGQWERDSAAADSQRRGMGIGLSVCDAIIRAHGGRLRGENRPGGGARFRFALEMEDEDE